MLNPRRFALRVADAALPIGRHVPFVLQQLALEQALGAVFAQQVADGDFDLLRGRWLRLDITDLGIGWNLTCGRLGLQVAQHARADVSIRGSWRDFLLLASRQEDPDTLFFRRRLIIEGDTDLGLGIKNLMDSLDPDQLPPRLWQLMRWCGSAVAQSDLADAPTAVVAG
jgi:O2-independent ubiquinone biosynthesis accessory factor UbiT